MMSRPELSRVMWGWCNDMQMLPSEFWDTRDPVTDDRGEHIWVISQETLKLNFNSYLGVWIYNFEQKQSSVKPTLLLPGVKLSCSWDDSDSLLTAMGPFPPMLHLSPASRGMWWKKWTRLKSTGKSPARNLEFGLWFIWTLDFFNGLRMTQSYQLDRPLSQRLLNISLIMFSSCCPPVFFGHTESFLLFGFYY